MRVLILGGTGMLGHKLVEILGNDSALDVHASVRALPPVAFLSANVEYHASIDLSKGAAAVGSLLRGLRPDVVINAVGAIKQKDLATDIEGTYFVNGTLPHLIPHLNPNSGGRVIHFSTDCVFAGDRGNYDETERPDALDVYGRSKACGEIDYGPHLTLRTSIIGFELNGHLGLLSWLFRQPRGSEIRGFSEAIFSGLPTVTLARSVHTIVGNASPISGLRQIASEPITKLDLLARLNERFGLGLIIRPDASVRIDRSLNDAPFRDQTHTHRPEWRGLIEELVHDFEAWPYREVYARLTAA